MMYPAEGSIDTGRVRLLVAGAARLRAFAWFGRRFSPVDRALYRVSSGRLTILGPQARAMPATLLLTTIGRRTGRVRTTPVMYLRDGERLIVTSESFGQRARPAAWPRNLAADPRANVQIGRQMRECHARAATEAEIDRYWPRFVELWPAHSSYLERSGERHMYVLLPTDAGGVR